jgi:O-acetyl-ADP-ribose deacetylase (regulator of RNase III)
LAVAHELKSIAFPALSCGAYGYPIEDAATISAAVVQEHPWALDEIRFVLFSVEVFTAWKRAFE